MPALTKRSWWIKTHYNPCSQPSTSRKQAEKVAQPPKRAYSSMVSSDVVKKNNGKAWTSWSTELKGLENNEPEPKQGMLPTPIRGNSCNICAIWLQNGYGRLVAVSLILSEHGCLCWLFNSGLIIVCWVWDV